MSKSGKDESSATDTATDSEAPLRASREASLGADGLNVSKASGTVPSTPPDDSREPAYAGTRPVERDDSRASREANLGGSHAAGKSTDVLSPDEGESSRGTQPGDPDPERDWAKDAKLD